MPSSIMRKIKRVKLSHLKDIWKFPVALAAFPFYRLKKRNLWIVSEAPAEARDNGYWFYKYVKENHPEQECVYAIKSDSVDYDKVKYLGDTVEYGSLLHWILYFASRVKISSQKAGNPNSAIFHFLEVSGLMKNKRVFLQHGIVKDDLPWLYYKMTKFRIFICGAHPEYEYVNATYGYPQNYVQYTGLCRFDGLHDYRADSKLILIMPTWREWIADEDSRLLEYEGTTEIPRTNYFIKWSEFIQSDRLKEMNGKYGVRFIFFPHREMQKYLEYFPETPSYVEIAGGGQYDVQDLLKKSSLMVTDYSSVFFDFIYMKKPLLFYQFDYDAFRKGQYAEGYFDYKDNPFANSITTKEKVFDEMERYIANDYKISEEYIAEHAKYFRLYDRENTKRVYDVATRI